MSKSTYVTLEERIEAATEHAMLSFWEVVATEFPEVTTGDFMPDQHLAFQKACSKAVTQWVESNKPEYKKQDNEQ